MRREPFMTPEIWSGPGYEIDTTFGTEFLPGDVVSADPSDLKAFRDYCEGDVINVTRIRGHFGRLSAAGYLDCTPWTFGTNRRELERELWREARD